MTRLSNLPLDELFVSGAQIAPDLEPHPTNFETATRIHETLVEEGLETELYTLDAWLSRKVKGQLVAELYANAGMTHPEVNLRVVSDVLEKEIRIEEAQHRQTADHVFNTLLPLALERHQANPSLPNYFWAKDVANLEARYDIHKALSKRMEAVAETGKDGLRDLTDRYIERTIAEARDEVYAIIVDQKNELEMIHMSDELKIERQKNAIQQLKLELDDTQVLLADARTEIGELKTNTLVNFDLQRTA
jgi:hypothetical protein